LKRQLREEVRRTTAAAEAERAEESATLDSMAADGRYVPIKFTGRQLHLALANGSLKLNDVDVDASSVDRDATSADMRIKHGMTERGFGQHPPDRRLKADRGAPVSAAAPGDRRKCG
jgi:hypothetical protein